MDRWSRLTPHELNVLESVPWLHGPARDALLPRLSLSRTQANSVVAGLLEQGWLGRAGQLVGQMLASVVNLLTHRMSSSAAGSRALARSTRRRCGNASTSARWPCRRGTFALQGHDPESEVHFRSIKVKLLD